MRFNFFKKPEPKIFNWLKNNYILVLIIVSITAAALSLAIGLMQSVWFDEAYSIMLAKHSVSEIIRLTSLDTHPPLYYLLLSGWGNVFGWSELALRSLSVLAMGGAVVLSGLLAKKMFGLRAAVITLPFIAFTPFLIRYGFEIRMYAIASLIGIAATYVLVCALESKNKLNTSRLYAIYAVLVALGVYTLYYTVLLWAAHFIWLLYRNYRIKESIIKSKWFESYFVSVIMFLPWLPTFLKQVSNGALAPISQSMTVDNLLGIVSFSFLYRPIWQLDALLSLIFVFTILVIGHLSCRVFYIIDRKSKSYLLLLAMYLLVPIAVLTLVGLLRPMYVERYLAHVLIGGMMFLGVSVALVTEKSKRSINILVALLVFTMAIGIVQLVQVGNYNFQRLQHPGVDKISSKIKDCGPKSTILAADPYVAIELSYYTECPIYFYSDTKTLSGGYSDLSNSNLRISNPAEELKSLDSIYYIYYGEPKLKMPSVLTKSTQTSYGELTIELFTSNKN